MLTLVFASEVTLTRTASSLPVDMTPKVTGAMMALVSTKACHQASELSVLFRLETDFSIALGNEVQLWVVPLDPFVGGMLEMQEMGCTSRKYTTCQSCETVRWNGNDGGIMNVNMDIFEFL